MKHYTVFSSELETGKQTGGVPTEATEDDISVMEKDGYWGSRSYYHYTGIVDSGLLYRKMGGKLTILFFL